MVYSRFFHLISDNYPIEQFRSDLKDLAGLFYCCHPWLDSSYKKKMAETSVITQKLLIGLRMVRAFISKWKS